jgi:predicted nicotinamide N-methyase
MTIDEADREHFIRARTALGHPPLVPEIALHLAGDVMGLWGDTESRAAVQASGSIALPPPYWGFAWPGGQALARYIIDNPERVKGSTVLDFGAGSGLVAIAAAKAGAACVVAAETDPLALVAIELNASANAVFIEPLGHDIIGTNARWDTILAGDMCYERPLAERLLPWLRALTRDGVHILIADPGRNYFPQAGVTKLATYSVPTSLELEDRAVRETSVYELQSS